MYDLPSVCRHVVVLVRTGICHRSSTQQSYGLARCLRSSPLKEAKTALAALARPSVDAFIVGPRRLSTGGCRVCVVQRLAPGKWRQPCSRRRGSRIRCCSEAVGAGVARPCCTVGVFHGACRLTRAAVVCGRAAKNIICVHARCLEKAPWGGGRAPAHIPTPNLPQPMPKGTWGLQLPTPKGIAECPQN